MIIYKVSKKFFDIDEIRAVKALTEKSVFFESGQTIRNDTEYSCFFKTRKEAVEYLFEILNKTISKKYDEISSIKQHITRYYGILDGVKKELEGSK